MTQSGFFNSVGTDRTYNADDFNEYFNGVLSDNGVYKKSGNGLEVEAGSGMSVNILTGRMRIKQHYFVVTATENLTLEASDMTNPRYDAVVIRYNANNRNVTPMIVKGTASASPVKPVPTRSINIYDMILAYVYVPANSSSVESSNIEDVRNDEGLCGYTKLLVDAIDAQIMQYTNTYTSTAAIQVLNPNIPEFEAETDLMDVYANGLKLMANEYTIYNSGSQTQIELAHQMTAGNTFEFVVTKAVVSV